MGVDQIISILVEKIDSLSNCLAQVEKENIEIKKEIAELKTKSVEVKTENTELKTENAESKARLNNKSMNSNIPPSNDGYMKPVLPKKKKGKHSMSVFDFQKVIL